MTWPETMRAWTNVHAVRDALAAGADPNARIHAVRNTPLLEALWEMYPSAEVVELLISHGADVEAMNDDGETPLWCAVRRGCVDAVSALLEAGAQPWRPVLSGRSAGRVALDSPIGELFADLAGAPSVQQEDRGRQAMADELIVSYSDFRDVAPYLAESMCVAFVGGLDEDEVIRRVGVDPADCPVVSSEGYQEAVDEWDGSVLWVGSPPGGGVVVYELMGITPVYSEFCGPVSADGAVVASTFDNPAGGDHRVNVWRDGTLVAWPSAYRDPAESDPPEAWLCRFGDSAHDFGNMACNLALMALLTGTRPDPTWLFEAPKRLVRADLET